MLAAQRGAQQRSATVLWERRIEVSDVSGSLDFEMEFLLVSLY